MSLSSLSINRPVLTIVMSTVILILGGIGFTFLGVRDYPSVDPALERCLQSVIHKKAQERIDVNAQQANVVFEQSFHTDLRLLLVWRFSQIHQK